MKLLKISTLFTLAFVGLFYLNSCKEPEVPLSDVLLGEWHLESGRMNGVLSVDTTNYRIIFNVDNNFNPSTYRIISKAGELRPNFNTQLATGQWRVSNDEMSIIFDHNSSSPSRVDVGEFDIEVKRIAVPLTWTDNSANNYEFVLAVYEEEE